jgi:hypothetical protein
MCVYLFTTREGVTPFFPLGSLNGGIMSKFKDVLKNSEKLGVQERIKAGLDEQSYKDFLDAVNNPNVKAAAIARALKELGIDVAVISIQRMRVVQ